MLTKPNHRYYISSAYGFIWMVNKTVSNNPANTEPISIHNACEIIDFFYCQTIDIGQQLYQGGWVV